MEPMPYPSAYLWNLCRIPRHNYGTYAAPLGFANATHPAFKQKQYQTLRHTNKTDVDNLAYHQILACKSLISMHVF